MKIKLEATAIWVAADAVDFRKSIDGLCMQIIDRLDKKPGDGIFIFYNKNRDKIKIIAWHRNGYVMIYKRFEKCKIKIKKKADENCIVMDNQQLSWLLAGLDWQAMGECNELKFNEYY